MYKSSVSTLRVSEPRKTGTVHYDTVPVFFFDAHLNESAESYDVLRLNIRKIAMIAPATIKPE